MANRSRRRAFNYLVSYNFTLKDGRTGNGSRIVDINSSVIYHRVYTKLYEWIMDNSKDLDLKTMCISTIQKLNCN
jgi:hypothetical protein